MSVTVTDIILEATHLSIDFIFNQTNLFLSDETASLFPTKVQFIFSL